MEHLSTTLSNIPIEFRRSRKAFRMRLQIDAEGKMTLVAPWRSADSEIQSFLSRHKAWAHRHLQRIHSKRSLRPKPNYLPNDIFYYFGDPLVLEAKPSELKRSSLKVIGDRMVVTLHRDIGKQEGVRAIRKAIRNFYRQKAEEVIRDRLAHFNEHYGFPFKRVAFRDQKSRWGSCSRAGNLNFNWRLIMAPIEVIDYVVVHELCHLREMNHGHRFWALVAEMVPNPKEPRSWLRENQILLTL